MQKLSSSKHIYMRSARDIKPVKRKTQPISKFESESSSSDDEDPLMLRPKKKKTDKISKSLLKSEESSQSQVKRVQIDFENIKDCSESFSLLKSECRQSVLEDLFEHDKCFYFNNHGIEIYPEKESKLIRKE